MRGHAVEWTLLRKKGNAWAVADHRDVPLEFAEEAPELNTPEMSAALKKACAGAAGMVSLTLPSDHVLLRVVELPSTELDELQGMVELQVDKFSPFPSDQMAVSFEVLQQGENSTRVLIAAVRNEHIDDLGAAFDGAGLLPHWIDVDILAWWTLLTERGVIAGAGREIVLLVLDGVLEMIIWQDGTPVVFRSLGRHGGLSEEGEVTDITEEISYTLASLETEWGAVAGTRIQAWSASQPSPLFLQRLGAVCGGETAVHNLEELPPVTEGTARRYSVRPASKVNLAPPAWRDEERARKVRHTLIAVAAVFLGLWVSAVSVFMVGLNRKRDAFDIAQQEASTLEQQAAEIRALQEKVKSLEQFADRTHSGLECLREVSRLLPNGVDLSSFGYKKGRSVNLRGEADREGPIFDFIAALEKSELFTDVTPQGISSKRRRGKIKTEFKVTLSLPGDES